MLSLGYFLSVYRNKTVWKIYRKEKESVEQNKKLKSEIQERQKAQVELTSSQKGLHDVLNAIPDPIHVVNRDFNIVFFNNAFISLNRELNLDTDVIGKNMFTVFPFLSKTQVDEMNHVFDTSEMMITEEKTEVKGKLFYTETRKIPVFKNQEVIQVMTIIRDISRKAEIEDLKQKNIEQKEILLREIHHRVKNNLAIVISLIDMQVRNNPNPEFIQLSREIEYRIRSMSLIHEHLYKSDELDRIPLDQYLISISHGVTRSYGSQDIRVVFDCEKIDTNIELAMPLGLIVTELLTNACKYSYPDKNGGEISVSLKREISDPNLCRISIRDKGVGLPEGFSLDDPKSMGLLIIKLLSEQIAAKLVIENHSGTSFSIIFKGFRKNNQY
jgi:PAS domain S-box-containing protein